MSGNDAVKISRRMASDLRRDQLRRAGPSGSPTPTRHLAHLVRTIRLASDWDGDLHFHGLYWRADGVLFDESLNVAPSGSGAPTSSEIAVKVYADSRILGKDGFVFAAFTGLWTALAPVSAVQFGVTTTGLTQTYSGDGTCSVRIGTTSRGITLTDVGCFLLNSGDTIAVGTRVVVAWRNSPIAEIARWEIISMRCQ